MSIQSQQIQIFGRTVNFRFYKHSDTNKPILKLLVLHGWNQNGSLSWENFIKQIIEQNPQKNLQILAPDMPGFGLSVEPNKVWGALDYAVWLKSFLEEIENQQLFVNSKNSNLNSNIQQNQTNLKKWDILGHSFGGAVAAVFCSKYPNQIQKLILVAPAIVRKPITKEQSKIQKISSFGKKIFNLKILKRFYQQIRKIWYKILKSPDYDKLSPKMSKIMQKVIREDLQNYLPQIETKTLICWGNLDKYTPFGEAFLIQKQLRNSEIQVFENINHGIHLHASQKLAQKVTDFL